MFIYFYIAGVVVGIFAGVAIEETAEETIGRSLVWPILVAAFLIRSFVRALYYSLEVLFNQA